LKFALLIHSFTPASFTTSMSSIRIEIDDQRLVKFCSGCRRRTDVTIDRTFPGALSSHMSASAWTQFCNKIDEALTTIGEVHLKMRKNGLMNLAFIPLAVGLGAGVALAGKIPLVILIGIVGVLFMVVVAVIECKQKRFVKAQLEEMKEDIKTCCRTEGDNMNGVSFHLKEEEHYRTGADGDNLYTYLSHVTLYIECSVSASPSMMEQGSLLTPVVALPVSDEVLYKSTAARLAGLEDIKGMLTEKEYNRKRRAILQEL
jgi:hypothetical protein